GGHLRGTDRDRIGAAGRVLAGGGSSSRVLPVASGAGLLPGHDRAQGGQAAEQVVAPIEVELCVSTPPANKSASDKLKEWVKAIVWTVVAWLLLTNFVIQAYRIPSPSMERTLMVGDVLFVNKFLFGAKVPFVDARTPPIREP